MNRPNRGPPSASRVPARAGRVVRKPTKGVDLRTLDRLGDQVGGRAHRHLQTARRLRTSSTPSERSVAEREATGRAAEIRCNRPYGRAPCLDELYHAISNGGLSREFDVTGGSYPRLRIGVRCDAVIRAKKAFVTR